MKTSDYEIFESISGNRKVNKSHVLRLAETIERKNLLAFYPVLLNEHMEIIDGQHRLAAAIKLQLPVYYEIVPGLKLQDVVAINTNSKGWGMTDFIDSHIALGNPDYVVLKKFIDDYGMGATLSASLLVGYKQVRGGGTSKMVKSGDFHVNSLHQAQRIAEQVKRLNQYTDFEAAKDRELIIALMRLNKNDKFDFERLISKMKTNGLVLDKRPSDKYYIILIEELYNWNVKAESSKIELYVSTNAK